MPFYVVYLVMRVEDIDVRSDLIVTTLALLWFVVTPGHSPDSQINFHFTSDSTEPTCTVTNNPLPILEAPIELGMKPIQNLDSLKVL